MANLTITTRKALESDIDDILALQSVNLYTNLSVAERSAGFVMTPFAVEQVNTLIDQDGAFVAEREGVMVGYVMTGSWDFFSRWPIFPYMVSRFSQLEFQGSKISIDNSFQYGPVCIDRAWRGTNVLPLLFETMKSGLAERFPIGATFINKQNDRSLAAHTRKLNLAIIDEFEFNGNEFYGLAFSTKNTNLESNPTSS